jgi:hypothetical protein
MCECVCRSTFGCIFMSDDVVLTSGREEFLPFLGSLELW